MYDQAITFRTLRNTLRRSDFIRYPRLRNPRTLDACIRLACRYARNFEERLPNAIKRTSVKGKYINYVASFPMELVLRKINSNLRVAFRPDPSGRSALVLTLCEALRDSNAYSLHRLDVKSFYESIDAGVLYSTVAASPALSSTTSRLLYSMNKWHVRMDGAGIPRGLSTSASLSEIYMARFDVSVSAPADHFYACRFADDIVLIYCSDKHARRAVSDVVASLPKGLEINRRKSTHHIAPKLANGKAAASSLVFDVEYLGYKISVNDPVKEKGEKLRRSLQLDIAESKVRKIKSRLTYCFLDFSKTADFDLLSARLRFLTSNYKINDKNGKFSRLAGIFFSYQLVDASSSKSLHELDLFLRKCVLSNFGPIFSITSSALTRANRNSLLANSFKKGFETRSIRYFSPKLIGRIQECWKYV